MLALGAVVVLAADVTAGAVLVGVLVALFLLLFAWLISPALPPRSVSAAAAEQLAAADGRPVVYWRPGCVFCIRLRLLLGPGVFRAHWVNIWRDPDGAAVVRGITGGDETVPTVVPAGAAGVVNPAPRWVRGVINGSNAAAPR